MDRLLQGLFGTFIRRGTFKLTTSRGRSFVFGDGTGIPVAVRFTSRRAEMGHAARSRAQIRRSLHGRHVGGRAGHDRRRAGHLARARYRSPELGAPAMAAALHSAAGSASSIRATRARRNVAHHYDLDGRLYSLFLDADRQYSCAYFESRSSRSTTRSSPRNGISPPSCCWTDDQARARHRLRLGRARALSRRDWRRRCHRRHAVQEQHAIANERAAEKGLTERARFQLQDYRDVHRNVRPHRFGRHVRACRRQPLRYLFPQMRRAAEPTTA